ncbi:MAG TPA: caspase family protein [Methylomirabilota bacterium]
MAAVVVALALLTSIPAGPVRSAWGQGPKAERPTYTVGDRWIRSDGAYDLIRIDGGRYVFAADGGREVHLTRDLGIAKVVRAGQTVLELDPAPAPAWPLEVGQSGITWLTLNSSDRQYGQSVVRATWRVEAYEDIRVPAGTFKAYRIVHILEPRFLATSPQSRRLEVALWYAPAAQQLIRADGGDLNGLAFQAVALDRPGQAPLALTLIDPKDKGRVTTDRVTLTGRVSGGSGPLHIVVTHNGAEVAQQQEPGTPGKDVPVNVPIKLLAGANTLVVTATDGSGMMRQQQRVVFLEKAAPVVAAAPTPSPAPARPSAAPTPPTPAPSSATAAPAGAAASGTSAAATPSASVTPGTPASPGPPVAPAPPTATSPSAPPSPTPPPAPSPAALPRPSAAAPPSPTSPPSVSPQSPSPATPSPASPSAPAKAVVASPPASATPGSATPSAPEPARAAAPPVATTPPQPAGAPTVVAAIPPSASPTPPGFRISISTPTNQARVDQETVTFAGVVSGGSGIRQVLISANGVELWRQENRTQLPAMALNLPVKLTEGQNTLVVTASETDGTMHQDMRTVFLEKAVPLAVDVRYPEDRSRVTDEASVVAAVARSSKGISRITVALNGSEVHRQDERSPQKSIAVSAPLTLRDGANAIVITALEPDGTARQEIRTVILERPKPAAPVAAPPPAAAPPVPATQWAVVIGVGGYESTAVPKLRYPVADADAIYQTLIASGGFKKENILLLTDKTERKPTLRNIKWALGTFLARSAHKDDLVVIYFAGHGASEIDQRGIERDGLSKYLVPMDADPDDLYSTALPMDEMQNVLARIEAERITVFLDACYSGAAGGRTFASTKTRTVNVDDIFLERLTRSKGRAIVTASRPSELSVELPELGHGLFTYYLVRGLQGYADLNRDGIVSLQELYEYLTQEVSRKSRAVGGNQHPMLKGELEGALPLTKAGKRN